MDWFESLLCTRICLNRCYVQRFQLIAVVSCIISFEWFRMKYFVEIVFGFVCSEWLQSLFCAAFCLIAVVVFEIAAVLSRLQIDG